MKDAIDSDRIYTRNVWEADSETPIFSQEKGCIRFLMPSVPDGKTPMMQL